MSEGMKRILSAGLILFLLLHFLLLLNYAAPLQLPGKASALSRVYCYPYFHQQWTVFVPAPDRRSELYIRNGAEHVWQPWLNMTEHFIKKQRKHPLQGRETEVLLLTNAISYVSYDLGERSRVFHEAPDLPSFKVMERASNCFFRNDRCWKAGKDYELLLVTKTQDKTYFYYFKNLSLL